MAMPLICSIRPTVYLIHMPYCVSLSHTSYTSGINCIISSYPIFDGYLDVLVISGVVRVIVSHISHMNHGESYDSPHMSYVEPISFNPNMFKSFGGEYYPQNCIYRPACCAAGENKK